MSEEVDSDLDDAPEEVLFHRANSKSKKRVFSQSHESKALPSAKRRKTNSNVDQDTMNFLIESDDESPRESPEMTQPQKKRSLVSSPSHEMDSDEEEQEENIDMEMLDQAIINQHVNFELSVVDIAEDYYHAINDMIGATDWNHEKLHRPDLTQTIIEQVEVGGVLVSDEAVVGFISLLPFGKYTDHLSLAHIRRFLHDKCKNKSVANEFNDFLTNQKVGVLLHERALNFPPQLIEYVYQSLLQDIEWVLTSNECDYLAAEEKECFDLDFILVIIRCRWIPVDPNENKEEETNGMDLFTPRISGRLRRKDTLVYEHLEDAFFREKAVLEFDFERKDKVWQVCLVPASELAYVKNQCSLLFGNSS